MNKNYLFASTVIIVVAATALYKQHVASRNPLELNVSIEESTGPYSETATNLVGLSQIGSKLLVASSERGIFSFSDISGWKQVKDLAAVGKIVSVNNIGNLTLISTETGRLIVFREESSDKFDIIDLGVSFTKIKKCNEGLIGLSDQQVYSLENDLKRAIPFQGQQVRLKSFDCHENSILVGTDGSGLLSCSASAKSCESFSPVSPSNHVTSVHWSKVEKTWIAGIYGDADLSVIKLNDDKWIPMGSRFGDVLQFVPTVESSVPLVVSESGYLFKYKNSDFQRISLETLVTPPVVEVAPGKLFGFSFKSLIEITDLKNLKQHGSPVILGASNLGSTVGNSFVWDIQSLPQGIVYAATSQAGVWWSSDLGRTWDQLNNGLTDSKIHFLRFNTELQKLVAGSHGRGLFVCNLPCRKWKQVADPRLTDCDLQAIAPLDETKYLIASEKGAFQFDLESEKVISHMPLRPEGSLGVSDFWTLSKLDNNFFFGIYAKPNRAQGVWQWAGGDSFLQIVNIEYPVTGIEKLGDEYIVGTIQGLFTCSVEKKCNKLNSLSVNRMSVFNNYLWLATSTGVARQSLSDLNASPAWLTKQPAQIVKPAVDDSSVVLVGTTNRGVMRIKLNE